LLVLKLLSETYIFSVALLVLKLLSETYIFSVAFVINCS